jgi:hypothetical protein
MDGDGLEDLIAVDARGRFHLLLAEDDGYRDATDDWRIDVTATPGAPPVAALCDLDGDGRPDLLARGHGRLHILLNRGYRLLDETSRGARPVPADFSGLICADLNRDGAPDLIIEGSLWPRAFMNRRHGHLIEVNPSSLDAGALDGARAAATPPPRREEHPLVRRLFWLRPQVDLPLVFLWLGALGAAHTHSRVQGARGALGRPMVIAALAAAGLAWLLWSSDQRAVPRLWGTAAAAAAALVAAAIEGWIARRR